MKTLEKFRLRFKNGFHISVGLDSDIRKIPQQLLSSSNPLLEFNKTVIKNTYKNAAAYKINFAFYEKYGTSGLKILEETIGFIPSEIPIIADAKRGDIGNTAEMYAKAIFEEFKCDAVTLHPYMGFDSLKPFINYEDKFNFILGLTSNPGASDFEKLKLENGKYLYQEVIDKIIEWNDKENLGVVFGATNLVELKQNIKKLSNLVILLPGIGKQGGDLNKILELFNNFNITNFIINISRGLIYSDNSKHFGKKIGKNLRKINLQIQNILSN